MDQIERNLGRSPDNWLSISIGRKTDRWRCSDCGRDAGPMLQPQPHCQHVRPSPLALSMVFRLLDSGPRAGRPAAIRAVPMKRMGFFRINRHFSHNNKIIQSVWEWHFYLRIMLATSGKLWCVLCHAKSKLQRRNRSRWCCPYLHIKKNNFFFSKIVI